MGLFEGIKDAVGQGESRVRWVESREFWFLGRLRQVDIILCPDGGVDLIQLSDDGGAGILEPSDLDRGRLKDASREDLLRLAQALLEAVGKIEPMTLAESLARDAE